MWWQLRVCAAATRSLLSAVLIHRAVFLRQSGAGGHLSLLGGGAFRGAVTAAAGSQLTVGLSGDTVSEFLFEPEATLTSVGTVTFVGGLAFFRGGAAYLTALFVPAVLK